MVARQHAQPEAAAGLLLPGREVVAGDVLVAEAAEGGDAEVEGLLRGELVGLVDREVGPQDGQQQPHQLGVLEHLLGRAVELPELAR